MKIRGEKERVVGFVEVLIARQKKSMHWEGRYPRLIDHKELCSACNCRRGDTLSTG